MDTIAIIDYGGQYCHLISRRIRDLGINSQILPANASLSDLQQIQSLKGVILSGGAISIADKSAPQPNPDILQTSLPILGICYGHQALAHLHQGQVKTGKHGEYGITQLKVTQTHPIFKKLNTTQQVWMNHKDEVTQLPSDFQTLASTTDCQIAAFTHNKLPIIGVQFHPEVTHTDNGKQIIQNFAIDICQAAPSLDITTTIDNINTEVAQMIGDQKAIIGLSGGIDSSTAAILVSQVIKENLTAVYVDTGLMRHQETEFIQQEFSQYPLNLQVIDAKKQFFTALKNVTDPEKKRKIIGRTFIEVFDKVAQKIGADILIQGTIYSDRIESGLTQNSSVIKSHHNVGGLPKNMKLKVYEPLRDLYKDEVRQIAKQLKLPDHLITRHVFPGPGLGIRIVGAITPKKAEIVRQANHIVEQQLKKANLYTKVWMGFAVLLDIKSVGIQGDARSYKYPIVVRIVESQDAMTANFSHIPYTVLESISTQITNQIPQVNRVVYDITNKPPGTMEWE